jgi:superfamily I DNA/RNA helicase
MQSREEAERDAAIERILLSTHNRRVIVAGAGTGKTSLFKKILERLPKGDRKGRVVLTFLSKLKTDLDSDLGSLALVQTFHGHCKGLLYRVADLRGDVLTEDFSYLWPLVVLIKSDWCYLRGGTAPEFLPAIRNLEESEELTFYEGRATYYDAIGVDDSVWRICRAISRSPDKAPKYELVIVDEFQDLAYSEVSFLRLIGVKTPLVIAGDDDQTIYGKYRGGSETYIREIYADPASEQHCLPVCMRCPSVIVSAVNDVIERAVSSGLLVGRINKPFRPLFPPTPPKIRVVETTVQSLTANYFGKYIHQQILAIPVEDIQESRIKGFPTVLVIGPKQFLNQVKAHLEAVIGLPVDAEKNRFEIDREFGISLLKKNDHSNLGWRIVLEKDRPRWRGSIIKKTADLTPLFDLVPESYRDTILSEVAAWEKPEDEETTELVEDVTKPSVELVSYEGSKGLSAQHVFIIGLQEAANKKWAPKDADVYKFVVAITRTRKRCHLIYAAYQSGKATQTSRFISWIKNDKREFVPVNKDYWQQ